MPKSVVATGGRSTPGGMTMLAGCPVVAISPVERIDGRVALHGLAVRRDEHAVGVEAEVAGARVGRAASASPMTKKPVP